MSSAPASPMERASVPSAEPTPPRPRPGMIQHAAVLGAGTMGVRIAAHLADAGIPVVLLDLAGDPARALPPSPKPPCKAWAVPSRLPFTTPLVCG